MGEQRILELGDPLLWQRSVPARDPHDSDVRRLVSDLSDTLAAFRLRTGFGRAIAAPQIGSLQRVLFVRMPSGAPEGPLINPAILARSDDEFELWDDCFSFPALMVRVRRAVTVRIEFVDEHGVRRTLDASGALSELLQHEIDHLDGVLAVDRAVSVRDFMTRSEWERQRNRSNG